MLQKVLSEKISHWQDEIHTVLEQAGKRKLVMSVSIRLMAE